MFARAACRRCKAPHKYTHSALQGAFSRLGLLVGLYPWAFIAFTALVTGVCAVGFSMLETVRQHADTFQQRELATTHTRHPPLPRAQAVDYEDTWIPKSSVAQVRRDACEQLVPASGTYTTPGSCCHALEPLRRLPRAGSPELHNKHVRS